jgi:hypothetical protein
LNGFATSRSRPFAVDAPMTWASFDLWLTKTPLTLLGLLVLAAMALAIGAGMALRKATDRRNAARGAPVAEGLEGIMVSAILGLMALLMGFTFAIVLNRFEDRRELVLQEANAIGTVYLRTQLLEEPHRTRISKLLVEYTDQRIVLAKSAPGENAFLIARNDRLITQLWAATMSAYPSIKEPGLASRFLECMNGMIDLDTSRKMARGVHVPAEVYFTVFVFLVATALILGYLLVGRRGRVVLGMTVVLLSLVLIMILDADRPNDGGIREDQLPMEMLKASLESLPAGAYEAYRIQDAKAAAGRGGSQRSQLEGAR